MPERSNVERAVECARWGVHEQARLVVAKHRTHAVRRILHVHVKAKSLNPLCWQSSPWALRVKAPKQRNEMEERLGHVAMRFRDEVL